MLLARLRVRLRHREGLPERPAALGGDHDHSRARRSLEDQLPFLRREVSLSRHRRSFGRLFLISVRDSKTELLTLRPYTRDARESGEFAQRELVGRPRAPSGR